MSLYQRILTDLQKLNYQFRINDLDETLEIRQGEAAWQRLNDVVEASLRTNMRELGYGKKNRSLAAMRDAYITFADQNRYNPIKDYFTSLEGVYYPAEGETPYKINALASHFVNPDGQFKPWLFKWMVGTVAKIFEGERNPMLVLVAPQRIGKSYFAGWICPLPSHFLKSGISPDSKDANLRLADILIWEVEELGATTRRADMEALKAFITKHFIYERPPYGRHPIHKPVTASFIGTVNFDGAGFLTDPTGSTRFLSCEIERIDFGYTAMDVNHLWAEAYWFYQNKPGCWKLTEEEQARQAEVNSAFETTSALQDVLESQFEVTFSKDDFLSTQEIKQTCRQYYQVSNEQAFYNELARVLTKIGLTQGRGAREAGAKRGWVGIKARNKTFL